MSSLDTDVDPLPESELPLELVKDRPLLHMVTGDGEFNMEIEKTLSEWKFYDSGLGYNVIAILGAQSSGKSTLLNLIFGTDFQVMDAKAGRHATTMGVWLGQSGTSEQPLLLLDVEGTDSRERGEDHCSFERKTSLFSLALAEVLIINLWVTDIGRFDGANYGLLKIVLELNLQLFQTAKTKTLLFFVFRDHAAGQTFLDNLAQTIKGDMSTIWAGISKPEEHKNSKIEQFFDFAFTSLPHKLLEPKFFIKRGSELRERFLNPEHEKYLFVSNYNKQVPSDGFFEYTKGVWKTILENKDLDLPTQKEMLALYRCEEIMDEAFCHFAEHLQVLDTLFKQDKAPISNFGTMCSQRVATCLEEYDNHAKRYHEEVNLQKRKTLVEKISSSLRPLYNRQIKYALETVEKYLADASKKRLLNLRVTTVDFYDIILSIKNKTTSRFDDIVRDSVVLPFKWDCEDERQSLKRLLQISLESLLIEETERIASRKLKGRVFRILETTSDNAWVKVGRLFSKISNELQALLRKQLTDLSCGTESSTNEHVAKFKNMLFRVLRTVIADKAHNLPILMESTFQKIFSTDENGLPRRWKAKDDVKGEYLGAMLKAERLVDLFSIIRIEEEDAKLSYFHETESGLEPKDEGDDDEEGNIIDPSKVVLTMTKAVEIVQNFRKTTESSFLRAIRAQEEASGSRGLPVYVIVLLMVLGFNEFTFLLRNPLLLIILLLFAAIGGILYYLPFTRPVLDTLWSVLTSSGTKWLSEKLKGSSSSSSSAAVGKEKKAKEIRKKED